jgi:hypothetical protein
MNGSIQLLSQFTQFIGVLSYKELMNKSSDWISHGWLASCTVARLTK